MKGTILDLNEELETGQILGEDGSRYLFNIDEWKSKNKAPEIDVEVDFIIKDNIATEIFSLSKTPNTEQNLNRNNLSSTNVNSNFKKIDFQEIEKEMYSDKRLEENRTKITKGFFILLAVDIVGYFFTKTGLDTIAYIVLFFSVPFTFFMIFPFYKLVIKKDVNPQDIAQNMTKNTVIDEVYGNSVTILNYIPNDLNHNVIKMISSSANNYEDAKKQLIRQAYDLKADGILNFTQHSNSQSDTRTVNDIPLVSPTQIKTKVTTTHRLEGIAVKFV